MTRKKNEKERGQNNWSAKIQAYKNLLFASGGDVVDTTFIFLSHCYEGRHPRRMDGRCEGKIPEKRPADGNLHSFNHRRRQRRIKSLTKQNERKRYRKRKKPVIHPSPRREQGGITKRKNPFPPCLEHEWRSSNGKPQKGRLLRKIKKIETSSLKNEISLF